MSLPALIVVVAAVLLSVLTVVLLFFVLRRQLRALLSGVTALQTTVLPQLEALTAEAAAAQELLARTFGPPPEEGPDSSSDYTEPARQPTAGMHHG